MTAAPLDFELLAFFPADHAEAPNGKLYVNGAFWVRLNFPAYPQVLPSISLVAVLKVPFAAYHAEHQFEIVMEDPDGKPLAFQAGGAFRVGADADMEYGDPTLMPIVVPVTNLLIERPGDYTLLFKVDGNELGRYTFRARQVAVPMQFKLAPPPPQAEAS